MVWIKSFHCVNGIKEIFQRKKTYFLSSQDLVGFWSNWTDCCACPLGGTPSNCATPEWSHGFGKHCQSLNLLSAELQLGINLVRVSPLTTKKILRTKNTFETFVSGTDADLIASERAHFPLSAASRPPALSSICCRHRRGPWEDSCRPVD